MSDESERQELILHFTTLIDFYERLPKTFKWGEESIYSIYCSDQIKNLKDKIEVAEKVSLEEHNSLYSSQRSLEKVFENGRNPRKKSLLDLVSHLSKEEFQDVLEFVENEIPKVRRL